MSLFRRRRIPPDEVWVLFSRGRFKRVIRRGSAAIGPDTFEEVFRFRADDPTGREAAALLEAETLGTTGDLDAWLSGRDFPSRDLYEKSKRANELRQRDALELLPRSFRGAFIPFLAVVIAVGVFSLWKGHEVHRRYLILAQNGRTVPAEITAIARRQGSRGGWNYHVTYAYRDDAGRVFTGRMTVFAGRWPRFSREALEVTYRSGEPQNHVPFRLTPGRVSQPLRSGALFAAAAFGLTALFGFLVWRLIRSRLRWVEDQLARRS